MTKIGDYYNYKEKTIYYNKKLGGWVVSGDFNLYVSITDAMNAIDKANDSSHKAEPRVLRKMTDVEFIFALQG